MFIAPVLFSDCLYLLCDFSDLCKSDEFNSVRKEEDLARNNLEQSETQFEARYLD